MSPEITKRKDDTQKAREDFVGRVKQLMEEKPESFAVYDIPNAMLPHTSVSTDLTLISGRKFHLSVTQERDPRRPAYSFMLSEKDKHWWNDGLSYRLDVCSGYGAVEDATILSGRGQSFMIKDGNLVSWSDSWAETNIRPESALHILDALGNIDFPDDDPTTPNLAQFKLQSGSE